MIFSKWRQRRRTERVEQQKRVEAAFAAAEESLLNMRFLFTKVRDDREKESEEFG